MVEDTLKWQGRIHRSWSLSRAYELEQLWRWGRWSTAIGAILLFTDGADRVRDRTVLVVLTVGFWIFTVLAIKHAFIATQYHLRLRKLNQAVDDDPFEVLESALRGEPAA